MSRYSLPRLLTFISVIVLASFSLVPINLAKVQAAGVALTIVTPSNGEFNASTQTDVSFRYLASATQFASGNTVIVTISPALAGAVSACATPTTDADGDTTTDGSFGSFTTTGATYTFSAATTTATTGSGVTFCLRFANTTTTGIYSIAVTDNNDNDFGAALVYVGDDNDVTITAVVAPTLAMAIRNNADTADTNACALGSLTVSAVNTCDYRIKVTTNAASGYTVNFLADGDLRRSGSGDVADADDIDLVVENNTVSAGTEAYGVALTGGSATGGSITESGNFNDDDTPIPNTSTSLYTASGPNNPGATDTTNTALVTHRAAIDGGTNTGNYNQVVTYRVTATF